MANSPPNPFPANPNDPSSYSAIYQFLNKIGIPATDQGVEFLQKEWEAQSATGGHYFANGFTLPQGDSSSFFELFSLAEKYASMVGWTKLPTPIQLQWGAENGVAQMDTKTIFGWFSGLAGTKESYPWAALGMTKDDWSKSAHSIDEQIVELTGASTWETAGLDPGLKQEAMANNWSAQTLKDYLMKSDQVKQKYGWVQYGMGYNDFQKYKLDKATQATSRYGAHATDAQYLQDYADPLVAFSAQGTSVAPQTAGASSSSQPPTMTGHQSQVR